MTGVRKIVWCPGPQHEGGPQVEVGRHGDRSLMKSCRDPVCMDWIAYGRFRRKTDA